MKSHVVLVGSFPPPISGAALVNQMVLDALGDANVSATALDVSVAGLAHRRSLSYHLRRLSTNLHVARAARGLRLAEGSLYVVPDAGLGAWYTAGILRGAANGFARTVIHHHSCRYIIEQSRPMALLTEQTRARATHVFLTPGMAEAFCRRYGDVRVHVATNARFVAAETAMPATPRAPGPIRIGQLSNLCADKGFFTTAESFEVIRAAGVSATLTLAGPALEPEVERRITELSARYGDDLRYLGPVTGEAKQAFYRNIDLFLFPTQWRQEAAPLVIYEALAAGVPVLATDRGVIRELIGADAGAVCDEGIPFSSFTLDQVRRLFAPELDMAARGAAIKRDLHAQAIASIRQYEALLALLAS